MPELLLAATAAAAFAAGLLAAGLWSRHRLGALRERQHEALQQALNEARLDPLTGAWNRKAFDEALSLQTAISRRYISPLAVVLIDVDHLKAINDREGHAAGDVLLKTVARSLRNETRDADLVARLGGDEFALLLPQTDVHGAEILARRLLVTLKGPRTGLPDEITSNLTATDRPATVQVSIGVAALDAQESAAQFMHRADQALYRAKQAGGQRLCLADDDEREVC